MEEAFRHVVTGILSMERRTLERLLPAPLRWHGPIMASSEQPGNGDRPSMGGGIFLFISLLIGAIAGTALGQPSLGTMAGFVVGGILALIVWLVDRNRAKKEN